MSMIRKGLAAAGLGAAAAAAIAGSASAHGVDDNDGVDLDVQDLLVDVEDTGQVATNNADGQGGGEAEGAGVSQGDEQWGFAGDDNDLVDVDVQGITALLEDVLQIGVND